MVQLGIGCPDNAIPGFTNFQAEIDIVKRNHEIYFVKTPNLVKDPLRHQHASGSDAREIMDKL